MNNNIIISVKCNPRCLFAADYYTGLRFHVDTIAEDRVFSANSVDAKLLKGTTTSHWELNIAHIPTYTVGAMNVLM